MKILSIAVPCYNSQEYMRKCVDSLLKGGEDVEILIVDDGSKDDTLKIARDYEEKYPTIVKAIHQENKGHGGAVNTGLAHATGLYFKVVDSDDWLNEEALKKALEVLKLCVIGPKTLDLLLCNYVYEKVGAKRKTVMRYRSALPQDKIFGWDDVKPLGTSHYLLMHSMIYRTELLRECGLKLPEHTFYVDNLVAFIPLASVQSMYYLDVNLYRYFIGRADQSVSESVMIGRVDQQIRVNKLMIDYMGQVKNLHRNQRVLQSLPAYACRPTRSCECEDFLFCKFLLYKVFSFPCGSPLFSHIFQFRQSVRRQLHLLSSVFATIIANLFFPYNVQNF